MWRKEEGEGKEEGPGRRSYGRGGTNWAISGDTLRRTGLAPPCANRQLTRLVTRCEPPNSAWKRPIYLPPCPTLQPHWFPLISIRFFWAVFLNCRISEISIIAPVSQFESLNKQFTDWYWACAINSNWIELSWGFYSDIAEAARVAFNASTMPHKGKHFCHVLTN